MAKNRGISILQEFSIPLITGVVLAVIWANIAPNAYHAAITAHLLDDWFPLGPGHPITFHFLMNDGLMVAFFGIAAKEITESMLPGGALNPIKKAINPIVGTLGGVIGPVAVFMLYVHFTGSHEIAHGWAIPTATDIALAWLVAKIVFGQGHPAISFLLLIAIVDDGLGLAIIAIFYGDPNNPVRPAFLLVVLAGILLAYTMRRYKVKSHWLYFLGPGTFTWWGLMLAHLHPALAAVFVVPFMPTGKRDTGLYNEAGNGRRTRDTLNEFEHFWKLPVDFGLFGFGLANAGVAFSDIGHATWAVFLGLLVGKAVGIFGFSAIADKCGFPLPTGMTYKSLSVAALIAGLGLTVALFVAGVAYTDPKLIGAAKMGALLSVLVAPKAILWGWLFKVKKIPD